jgi:hypothetical protein
MIQTYKILNEIDRIDSTIFFELSAASVTRDHSQKIAKNTPDWEVGNQFSAREL